MSMYDGIIEVGFDGKPVVPTLVLASRSGRKIGVIQNVQSINTTHPLSDVSEVSFDVYKTIDGKEYSDWDKLKDFKLIQIPRTNDWFEAQVSVDEENDIVKHVTCVHANEAELGQLNLYETEINTESDIDRDDYKETYFYNEEDPTASLLNRILKDKAPHYQIYHVDSTLVHLFRQFSFNGTSIQDALNEIAEECGCIFKYGEWSENDGKYHRTISAYDLEDYCYNCQKRGNYTEHVCTNCGSTNIHYGYGEDTGIFISRENLANSINYETNADQVKNCFRLSAGDDIMTAAIKTCNPNMSQYLWYFSDDMMDDMSDELSAKITEYNALINDYKDTREISIPSDLVNKYNALVNEYGEYNEDLVTISYPILGTAKLTEAYYNAVNLYGFLKSELAPSSEEVQTTTALEQMEILQTGSNMSRVGISDASGTISYTIANSAIQSYAKVYIDTSRYKVTAFTNSIQNKVWTGTITIKSYIDDEDVATATFTITLFDSSNNNEYVEWVKQSVQKAMANREATDLSIINLFDNDVSLATFKEKLKLYSLDNLSTINNMATSAITIMVEQGIADSASVDEDIYGELYLPYLNKSKAVEQELEKRELQLSYLLQPTDDNGNTDPRFPSLGLLDIIAQRRNEIANILDIQTFLGDELWEELSFYRRENEYQNANYISDGLTDSEIIEYAQRFFDEATKEIIKSSTLQNTISAPLANFLLMEEFKPLQSKFKVGNWIHLKVDDRVYKLRLTNWTVDYDDIEDLDVEFSDVVRVGNIITDTESILSKSRSMATTYDYTAKQANKGKDADNTLKLYRNTGIDFSKIKAITSNGNTNIVYDDDGILLKRVNGTDVLPEQARIYNNGIYITKDAWQTVSTGLGHYSYVDPETHQTVQTYGIIADTVIGKLILGDQLKIFTQSGNFKIDDDGLTASNGTYTIKIDPEAQTASQIFSIYKTQTPTDKLLFVDTDGDLVVKGDINAKTLSAGSKTSSATGQGGLFIDSNGNLYSGSSNQTIIYANGNFKFGGTNGINFDGTNITLGSDCTISWNRVADKPDIATTSQIPTKVSQLNNDSNFQNATQVTTITENTISTTNVLAQNLRVKAAKIDGEITANRLTASNIGTESGDFIISDNGVYSYSNNPSISWSNGSTNYNYYTKAIYDNGCISLGAHSTKNANPESSVYWTSIDGSCFDMSKRNNDGGYTSYFVVELKTGSMGLTCNLNSEFTNSITVTGGIYGTLCGNVTRNDGSIQIKTTQDGGYISLETLKGAVAMSGSGNAFIPVSDSTSSSGTTLGSSSRHWYEIYAKNATINTSDFKEKDVLGSIDYAEDLIMNLSPIRFMWKNGDHRRTRMGFIAQDVAEVCKNLNQNLSLVTASYNDGGDVPTRDYFGEDADDNDLIWGISYEQLIAPMVAVIQNQERRIAQLESIINKE